MFLSIVLFFFLLLREGVWFHSRLEYCEKRHFDERETVETRVEDESDRGEVRFREFILLFFFFP